MATRFYQFLALALLITLVAAGLNTSNQGINQVSRQSRPPVVGLKWQNHALHADWLGKSYDYPVRRFIRDLDRLRDLTVNNLASSGRKINNHIHYLDCNLVPGTGLHY